MPTYAPEQIDVIVSGSRPEQQFSTCEKSWFLSFRWLRRVGAATTEADLGPWDYPDSAVSFQFTAHPASGARAGAFSVIAELPEASPLALHQIASRLAVNDPLALASLGSLAHRIHARIGQALERLVTNRFLPASNLTSEGLSAEIPSRLQVELFIPFFGRKEWKNRLALLSSAEVQVDPAGRLILHINEDLADPVKRCTSALGLAAHRMHDLAVAPTPNADFRLSHHGTWHAARPELEGLRRLYQLEPATAASDAEPAPEPSARLDPVFASLTIEMPSTSLAGWFAPYRTRNAGSAAAFARVSMQLQRALRVWLPFLWFRNAARYEDLLDTQAVLLYGSSQAASGSQRSDLIRDPLSPRTAEQIYYSAARRIGAELAWRKPYLAALGIAPIQPFYYLTREKITFCDQSRGRAKRNRALTAILVTEAQCIDALIRFSLHALQMCKQPNPDFAAAAERLMAELDGKLGWLCGDEHSATLTAAILLHATRGLDEMQGRDSGIAARLTLRSAENSEQVITNSYWRA